MLLYLAYVLSHLSGIQYFVLWELAWVCVLLQVFSHHSHSYLYSQNILYIIIWSSSNVTGFLACSTVISGQAAAMFYLSLRQWHSQIPGPVGTQKSFVEKMKAAEVYRWGPFISLFASLLLLCRATSCLTPPHHFYVFIHLPLDLLMTPTSSSHLGL